MSNPNDIIEHVGKKKGLGPFRRAVLRGFGVLLPPLLTIVILLWAGNTVVRYLLDPVEAGAKIILVRYGTDIRSPEQLGVDPQTPPTLVETDEGDFRAIDAGRNTRYVPNDVAARVEADPGDPRPMTAKEVYRRYIDLRWAEQKIVIRIFLLCVFVLLLYLLGKFLAAGMGRFFWNQFERLINRVPLVRNIYSSVKQVTDFLFSETDLEYTRVVAVEYPRKGIWTVAFVTGESMLDIESAANEPVMSVLIPTSPMPFTGFTITVKKSETVDLNLTVDQAFQFVVSCGVVIPPQQLTTAVTEAQEKKRLAETAPSAKSTSDSASVAPSLAARDASGDN